MEHSVKEYLKESGYDDQSTVIQWPGSQRLMEMGWFDECELINDETGLRLYGNSAYIVPVERLSELLTINN